MENYSRIGDFVIKTPNNLNREFYEGVLLDESGSMREPLLCMRVACIQDRIFFRGITEGEYYRLAGELYNFGAEHGVPAEEILLTDSPEWYGRPMSDDAPNPDKMHKWIGVESAEERREFYVEDAFPDPVKFLFEGKKRECIVTRLLRRAKYGDRKSQPSSQIKGTFFEDDAEAFIRDHFYSEVTQDEKGKKKFHINGTLSLASDESHRTTVNFTGSYEKALELFRDVFMDRARYNLDK